MGESLPQLDMIVRDALAQFPGAQPATREGWLSALLARTEPNIQQQILPVLRRLSPAASSFAGLSGFRAPRSPTWSSSASSATWYRVERDARAGRDMIGKQRT